jgi:hypothetical protein
MKTCSRPPASSSEQGKSSRPPPRKLAGRRTRLAHAARPVPLLPSCWPGARPPPTPLDPLAPPARSASRRAASRAQLQPDEHERERERERAPSGRELASIVAWPAPPDPSIDRSVLTRPVVARTRERDEPRGTAAQVRLSVLRGAPSRALLLRGDRSGGGNESCMIRESQ